ncbi:MAG: LacI family DNA-binding transcriptional regulator [Terriglobia bacterium]
MRRSSGRVKLVDVARAAGVSASTVSRLISGRAGVTPEMRDRVVKAAVRLGFDLDVRKKSRILAFLLSNRGVLHPFHSAVLMGAEACAAEHEYGLLFLPFQYSNRATWQELRLPAVLERRQIVSGVIVAGTNSQNLLDLLARKGIPWVVLGNNVTGDWERPEASAVFFDDVGGTCELTNYLISLGHRQIAFVGNRRLPWFARRCEGYRKALEQAGLPARISEVNSTDEEEMGYLATKLVLQSDEPVTAILAGDDAVARGAYKVVRERSLNVPRDLSIVGFNDTPEASALHPPLTTVRVFTDQLGKQMAELLLKRIARPDLGVASVTLPTQLIKRESCAAAPSRPGISSAAEHNIPSAV